jgi:prepilin peptidase CpaA
LGAAEIVLVSLTGVAVSVSLVTDLRSRKILNVITYPALLAGPIIHGLVWGWSTRMGQGLEWSLIGLVVGGLPFLVFNAVNSSAFGMGDVKLMAAVGGLMGFPFIIEDLLYVALVGGVVALVALLWKGRLLRTLGRLVRRRRPAEAEGEAAEAPEPAASIYVPYGVAIAFGTLWAFLVTLR